ncbi:MAG: glycosyltransferase [Gemmatimonadota bacterium]
MGEDGYRVAHILPWPGVGGTEHATLRVARVVEPDGATSTAFCRATAEPVAEFFESAGVETARWKLRHPLASEAPGFLSATLRLAAGLKRRRIDLVHCADLLAAKTSGALAAKLAGLPVICHVRNRYDKIASSERRCLRWVDTFVFVSRDTWDRFDYPVSSERGRVIYDGIRVPRDRSPELGLRTRREVRRELGIPKGAKVIGTVCRVHPQKDFHTLTRAAARVVSRVPEVRFLVVGDTTGSEAHRAHFARVQAWLDEAGVARHFTFTGFRTDVDRLLDAMDLFVLCTHAEGFPLVILEAMARECPVIATSVDGVPEIVQHEATGLLHAHGDSEELASRILALLADDTKTRGLAEGGRTLVAQEFSEDAFCRNLIDLYRTTLARPPAR